MFLPPLQVKGPPCNGMSLRPNSSITSENLLIVDEILPTKMLMDVKYRKLLTNNEEENIKFQINYRAIYILVYAMDRNEYICA